MINQHQEQGHTCFLCGAKEMFHAVECRNCGGILKIALIVAALAGFIFYITR
ncbi:MAG: hypothetical protein G8345_12900 [Magnetococcales bacterium]|nr:hypothetical protein [Magnetococcales bacterium]NGZ27770.1 hypothetical protein [Magnetococcales bacterium]